MHTNPRAARAGLAIIAVMMACGCAPAAPSPQAAARTAARTTPPKAVPARAVPAASATSAPGPGTPGPRAASTYLAEGQNVRGTIVRAPSCAAGCPLSGDGTIVLYGMTWTAWTATVAVGRGRESILSCDPDCAAGPEYSVAVTVTLTDPVRDCATSGGALWLWTKAAFSWPRGLPAALRGPGAPYNPWTFTALRGQLGRC